MKTIPLTRGLVALVDDDDYEALARHKWHANKDGYAVRNAVDSVGRRCVLRMHRVIVGLESGDTTRVDHWDENKVNNQRYNLRKATHAQNQRNRSRQSNNTSGFKGVNWHKKNGLWQARIKVDGKRKSLGYYKTAQEAHAAYCKSAIEMHGEFANMGGSQ